LFLCILLSDNDDARNSTEYVFINANHVTIALSCVNCFHFIIVCPRLYLQLAYHHSAIFPFTEKLITYKLKLNEVKRMEKKQHLVALDLDGTLLTDDKRISERTKEIVQKTMAAGHIVVIAT